MTFVPVHVSALPPPSQGVLGALSELKETLSGRVSVSERDRLAYARDSWVLPLLWARSGKTPPPPDAVAWPSTEEELQRLVLLARRHQFPLIPFGSGGGTAGGTVAIRGGVTVDLKRFDTIALEVESHTAVVGAGVSGAGLARTLSQHGFSLGNCTDALESSTVGGWLANRAESTDRFVLSAHGVLGTGERFEATERPAALTQFLLGSEGALCFFTGARLRVRPLPEMRSGRAVEFPNLARGLEAMRRLVQHEPRPAVVRLIETFSRALLELEPTLLRPLVQHAGMTNSVRRLASTVALLLGFEGETRSVTEEDRAASAVCVALGGHDQGERGARNWHERRTRQATTPRLIQAGLFADTFDVFSGWDTAVQIADRVQRAASRWAVVCTDISHPSRNGCSISFTFVGSGRDDRETEERYQAVWKTALAAAISAGASVTHHQGIGLVRAHAFQEQLGSGNRAVLAALKRAFDPDGIMNPGKLGL